MKSDTELQRDILDELEWEPMVDAADIGVTVEDGVVTLSGTVRNYSQKWAAERAAKRVSGVQALAEEIEVRLPGSSQRTDSDIAWSAANALEWSTSVPRDSVRVKVENGWLSLEGEVIWQYQKRAAEDAVRHLTGVKGVDNWIVVKPRVKPSDVKTEIENALERNARLDAQKVQVETRGSKVILRGSVHSWAEREEAEDGAWAAPGVSEVENQIKIVS
jgi:osmotically-inducible protein OsmY